MMHKSYEIPAESKYYGGQPPTSMQSASSERAYMVFDQTTTLTSNAQEEATTEAILGRIPLFHRLAAMQRPIATQILERLMQTGSMGLTELEELIGGDPEHWLAVAQLVRAGYASEGRARLHLTTAGRAALAQSDRVSR